MIYKFSMEIWHSLKVFIFLQDYTCISALRKHMEDLLFAHNLIALKNNSKKTENKKY